MYQGYYQSYGNGMAGGVSYAYPYPVPETRDQFIRRYVLKQLDNGMCGVKELIAEAHMIWDESVNNGKA